MTWAIDSLDADSDHGDHTCPPSTAPGAMVRDSSGHSKIIENELAGIKLCKIFGIHQRQNRLCKVVSILTGHCTLNKHMHCTTLVNSSQSWWVEDCPVCNAGKWCYFAAVRLYEPRLEELTLDQLTQPTGLESTIGLLAERRKKNVVNCFYFSAT